jgi:hypothetical protein
VTFLDGNTQLGSPVPVNGTGTGGTFPPTFVANGNVTIATAGSHTLTAQYSGDSNYATSSTSITLNVLNPTTASVSSNPATVTYGNPLTITAIIDTSVPASNASLKPTGNVSLSTSFDGTITNLSLTQMSDSTGNWEIQVNATITPQSSESVFLFYSGDNNYAPASANGAISVNIPDFSLVGSGPLLVTAGQSGSVQISVVPASSTPSSAKLSCYGGLPEGYMCSFQPSSVNLANGATATATLTLSPKPAGQAITAKGAVRKSATLRPPGSNPFGSNTYWGISIATALATLMLLACPQRRKLFRPTLAFAAVWLISLMLGCGGGGGGGSTGIGGGVGGSGGTSGPLSTTTSVSSSAASVATGSGLTLTAKVTSSGSPTGIVYFLINGGWYGQANLVGGSATVTIKAPAYPGIYQVIADYGGDASSGRSTSAPLNQTVTGNGSILVIGQTGSLSHSVDLPVTLQ